MPHLDKTELAKLFDKHGLRWTVQRQLVLQTIQHHNGHISVEEIYNEIAPNFPALNRATIYRTLEVLSEVGIVTPVNSEDDLKRYELIGDKPHYHARCENCDKEVEIDDELIEKIQNQVRQDYGLRLHLEHFVGSLLCDDCLD